MPISNRVEEKGCFGKKDTRKDSDCLKECCHIMIDECQQQTEQNKDDENIKRLYGGD